MKRLLVLAVAVLTVITVTAVAPASRTGHARGCVRHLLPLTANAIGPAASAALRRERPADRPRVVSAALATDDRGRGAEAKFECGARDWRRTVVVYITLRAFLPSASLSERVDFVGRFTDGYRVWQVVH
ncbi:MAG: hypothetical protein WAL31_13050 [Gaiellaceae bacterium]